MNSPAVRRRLLMSAILPLCGLALLPGCAQFTLLGLLIGGPPHIQPEFERRTGESLSGTESKVVVVCYADPQLKLRYSKIDAEVATYVTRLMQVNRINAVEPDYVRAWIDEHPNWETAEEIGQALEADYVIEIQLGDFELYEPHSTTLFRGRTTAAVLAYKQHEEGGSELLFDKEVNFMYPTKVARSAYDQTELEFKRDFLSRLGEEIGYMFYPSYNGDKISWAT